MLDTFGYPYTPEMFGITAPVVAPLLCVDECVQTEVQDDLHVAFKRTDEARTSQNLQGLTTINEYTLLHEIGRGAYGTVWMAVNGRTAEARVRSLFSIMLLLCQVVLTSILIIFV